MAILEKAIQEKAEFLSEWEAKQLLSEYGIPVTADRLVKTADEAAAAAEEIGFPVVLKGCGRSLLHKTELDAVKLNLKNADQVREAAEDVLSRLPEDADGLLVGPMVDARREFLAGVTQDQQFGPVVAFGLGGIFTETIKDVAFRVAPFEPAEGLALISDVAASRLMNAVRGLPAIDRNLFATLLSNLSKLAAQNSAIDEIDCNPVLADGEKPVVVDALVKLKYE
ncbi:MAG: acetate--CoA ligase family protein [Candidatus Lernaella stagnicola]|nr:acetate--CoA ligase family protein [Candidatus Lernaella stagnicola]